MDGDTSDLVADDLALSGVDAGTNSDPEHLHLFAYGTGATNGSGRTVERGELNATVALVNFVREKSGRIDLDGAPLMLTVFSANNPRLAFNDLADQTDRDEQQGMMHLFAGAVLALRNPRAHRLLQDSPQEALDYIAFLSMLARQVDRAQVRR